MPVGKSILKINWINLALKYAMTTQQINAEIPAEGSYVIVFHPTK